MHIRPKKCYVSFPQQKITELMDAPVNINIPAHTVGRGQNPYMDRCMNCNTPRTDSIDGDEGLELLGEYEYILSTLKPLLRFHTFPLTEPLAVINIFCASQYTGNHYCFPISSILRANRQLTQLRQLGG